MQSNVATLTSMLSERLRTLTKTTIDHAARWNNGDGHTVAGGVLTESGQVILGLNTFHFLGGPCGEVAALSNHASAHPADPIAAIAAAYGPTRAVIAPCGKCRQVFFDISPDIQFVIREPNGLATRTARELLPFAYDWRDTERRQRLYMWEGYEQMIRSGTKRQTIRVDDPFRPGPAEIVFEKTDGKTIVVDATITQVRSVPRDALTDEDAREDGFDDLGDLHRALDQHYPGLSGSDAVDVVSYELLTESSA